MKTGRKRIISSTIFACIAIIQEAAFATSQDVSVVNNRAHALKDSSSLPSADVTTKGSEALLAL
jgi:hypothetical protein